MFGATVEKYCLNCKEHVKQITTILYMVDDKEYIDQFDCPKCKEDLAKEDKSAIRQARLDGKSVTAVMC